jgi:putative membrane protein
MPRGGLPLVMAKATLASRSRSTASRARAVSRLSPAPATVASVTDPQIAHIVVTANTIDGTFGELALTKAQSQAVKDFARTMIADHGNVNKQAVDLAGRLAVTPEGNDVSRQLQTGADQARAGLTDLSGAASDSAYIAREVQYHQAVLDALDQTLIPGAQNADLKALLETARPAFVVHLERARQVQGSLAPS